ncbi:MAG: C25 family cysteine peptidase [Planctomycetota bacterium]
MKLRRRRLLAVSFCLLLVAVASVQAPLPLPLVLSQDHAEPVDQLLIVTLPALKDAALEYAAARKSAFAAGNGHALDTKVLTVPECIAAYPRINDPAQAVRAAAHAHLLPAAANVPTASADSATLPGDDGSSARRYLLLIGDVPTSGQAVDPDRHVPCFYKHCQLVQEMPGVQAEWDDVASDNPYAARDADDDVPVLMVGRLPVSTPDAVRVYAAAVKEYETSPPPGSWQRKVTLFAGDPGFKQLGAQVRDIIEKSYEQAVIKNLSDEFAVTLTYANPVSPYTWPAPDFGRRIVEEVNEGAMYLNYLGHGWKDSVDTLKFNGRRYEVFTAAEAAKVDCRKGRPVAAFFTCYTGCFDMRGPSLAEALITNPRGPIGVIASSRVSNEINLLLEMAFLNVATRQGAVTLGELFTRTEREMLRLALPIPPALAAGLGIPTHQGYSDAKRTHLWLYNMFGDPTVHLTRPRSFLGMRASNPVQAGRMLETIVAAPQQVRRIELRLEAPRDTVLNEPTPLDLTARETEVFEAMRENHSRVNQRLVATTFMPAEAGKPTRIRLSLPAGVPAGSYIVRVLGYDADGRLQTSGATRVNLRPDDGTSDF